MVIASFPSPNPDELFYSVCARYQAKMDYPGFRMLGEILFGTQHAAAAIDLPGYLDHFVENLARGHMWSVDRIIDDHTLLPYYGAFMPSTKLEKLRTDMRVGNIVGLRNRMGILASHVGVLPWLRYCPVCVKEERAQVGECYWHRLHQAPGVLVCPRHGTYLENSTVAASGRRDCNSYFVADGSIPADVTPRSAEQDPYYKVFLHIASSTSWLLSQRALSQEPQELQLRTHILLSRLGLLSLSGHVRRKDLIRGFKERFARDFLETVGCELSVTTKLNWLTRMAAGVDGGKHPLYWLLFIEYVNSSAARFFSLDLNGLEVKPFGVGPWPCLNVTCSHYGYPVIETCHITTDWNMGQPIGHFACQCGFSYRRGGPDYDETDRYRFTKVESYGEIWEQRLRESWQDPAYNVRMIGRELAVNVETVKRQAARLGLPFPNAGRYRMPPKEPSTAVRVIHSVGGSEDFSSRHLMRTEWVFLMVNNPAFGINCLRSRSPTVYRWLVANDAEWLAKHLPTVAAPLPIHRPKTDWAARDAELSALIAPTAERIRQRTMSGRLVRVTKPEIGAELGIVGLLGSNLHRLPLTAAALKQHTETSSQFALRRIRRLVEQFSGEGRRPTRWGIIHELHLVNIVRLPEVSAAIDEAVLLLQSQSR